MATTTTTKAKIKAEFKDVQIGFNNSGVPLGMRDDIDILAKIAIESKDPTLLNLFETIPSRNEILEAAGEKFLTETASDKNNDKKNQTAN